MCEECDGDEDPKIAARKLHSQLSTTLLAALKMLETEDFTKRMGSGIMIRMTTLEGKPLSEEFMLAAEDLQEVKRPMIESIRRSLIRRRAMLQAELRGVEAAVLPAGPPPQRAAMPKGEPS